MLNIVYVHGPDFPKTRVALCNVINKQSTRLFHSWRAGMCILTVPYVLSSVIYNRDNDILKTTSRR